MRTLTWTRVRDGEAAAHGVRAPEAISGWVGRTAEGWLYWLWVQARPRHEPPYYASARVTADGWIERYGGIGDTAQRPAWMEQAARPGSWLCDQGDMAAAKAACEQDAARRREQVGPK